MGRIADALRSNLAAIAQSDARSLRELDQELQAATAAVPRAAAAPVAALPGAAQLRALLGRGSFPEQSVATLRGLCRQHGIRGFSKLRKKELVEVLERHGVAPPPRPLESFRRQELISLVRQLLALLQSPSGGG